MLTETRLHVRWMIRRDLPLVLLIEDEKFPYDNWKEDEFIEALRNRNTIGMVCEEGDEIVGFMFYELFPKHLQLINWGMKTEIAGNRLMEKIKSKLSPERRLSIGFQVNEYNVPLQLFLRKHQFRVVESYGHSYLFKYKI